MNTQAASSPPTPSQPSGPSRPSGGRRIVRALAWLFAALVLLLLLLAAAAVLALRTEWGTRTLWNAATRFAPGALSGELLGGTLADGIRLRNLSYRDATKLLTIDSVEGAWRMSWSPPTLVIDALNLGKVDLTQQPQPEEPAQMPQSLRLPLAFDLRSATIRQLVLHQDGAETSYGDIRLRAASDRLRHTLALQQAETPFGRVRAALQLSGDAPFPLAGSAGIDGSYQEQSFRAEARLSGSLQNLHVEADANGRGFSASADIEATPFDAVPLRRAQIKAEDFNPRALNPEWPEAELDLSAALTPARQAGGQGKLVVAGPVSLANARPGAIDKGLLPLASARAHVTLDADRQQLSDVALRLAGGGRLEGAGELRKDGSGEFALRAGELDLQAVHGSLRPTALAGPLTLKLADGSQFVKLDLADRNFSVNADAELAPDAITLRSARLKAGPARLDLQAALDRGPEANYTASGRLTELDPAEFAARMQAGGKKSAVPHARINMDFDAKGALKPELQARLRFNIGDSSYAGLPMEGAGLLRIAGKRILPSDLWLTVAGNKAVLKGSFGNPADRLRFDVDAPALDRIGFGLSGMLKLSGDAGGSLQRPQLNARYQAQKLALGPHRLASLSGEAKMDGVPGSAPDARIDLDLAARELRSGELSLASINADIDGSYASHTIRLDADGRLHGQPLSFSAGAKGRLQETARGMSWDGLLNRLENRSEPRISLAAPLPVSAAPGRMEIGAGRLSLARADIALQSLRYDNGRLDSKGTLNGLDIGRLLALQKQFTGQSAPVSTNLVLDGSWDVTLADSASGYLSIARRSGDVGIPGAAGERALGLNALRLRADLLGDAVAFEADANATRIGSVEAQGRVGLQKMNERITLALDAPLSARIRAALPRLQNIAALAGPSIALDGVLSADIAVGGNIAAPSISGSIDGDRLALTLYDQGVRLSEGVARIALKDNVAELREVVFRGGEGTVRATGSVPLDRAGEGLSASIVADRLQLLASPSGRLTVSGQATAANVDRQLQVSGKFTVDSALFSLPEKSAPRLDDDVIVVRRDQPQSANRKPVGERPAGAFTPRIDIAVDLGRDFRFEGSGAKLRLAGTVNAESAPNETPRAYGTVRVAEGSYEAFGAELEIERGLINFQGPPTNPNLNILAMRREQDVEAGVQITGTVQQPRVQLVSEPNVSDEEKLSWLIFGSSGGGAGDQGQAKAAAQGAALGLLNKFGGARVAKGLGLDQLSIGSSEFGMQGSQVVNLGKEITDKLFIGYEQSLAGAESVLKLTYELSRRWTVVVRGGAVTGLDLFYSRRFDEWQQQRRQ